MLVTVLREAPGYLIAITSRDHALVVWQDRRRGRGAPWAGLRGHHRAAQLLVQTQLHARQMHA
jgi:hypothetical protein